MHEHEDNATLIERRDASDTHAILRIRPDAQPLPAFEPGQFVSLGLARARHDDRRLEALSSGLLAPPRVPIARRRVRIVRRAYSIASSPHERDVYELFVALVPGGRLTPDLWSLAPGARCWVSPEVHGNFTLDELPHGRDLLLVATGTGVAPFVSMLRTYGAGERWRHVALVHGARRAFDLGYRRELEERAERDPRVTYLPALSREPDENWRGLRGRVQVALESELFRARAGFALDPEHCHALLCGNPAMIADVCDHLKARGFTHDAPRERGNIHFERYW
jgi:ferredoxin--NADP+ reductase